MYYIIKKQLDNPLTTFINFQVPKYIASKSSDSVIFEFEHDGKAQRKWIPKSEIILLTEDKEFFLKTIRKFKAVEATQQKFVNEAKENLELTKEIFTKSVNAEIKDFEATKNSSDTPCILKKL